MSDRSTKEQFERDGFVILRHVIPPEMIAELLAESEGLLARSELMHTDNLRCRWQDHIETGACLFDCFDPVCDLAPSVRTAAEHPPLLEILASLLGEPVYLFKDKLIFKPPGAKGYALHQDYICWPSFPKSFVTVIVPLDACDPENGATELFPGLHTRGNLSPNDGMYHELPLEMIAETPGVLLQLQPGDVAIFSGFTPHRSAANRSTGWRRQLYLSYNAASDGGDQRESHYEEFHRWLKDRYAEYGRTNTYFQ